MERTERKLSNNGIALLFGQLQKRLNFSDMDFSCKLSLNIADVQKLKISENCNIRKTLLFAIYFVTSEIVDSISYSDEIKQLCLILKDEVSNEIKSRSNSQ